MSQTALDHLKTEPHLAAVIAQTELPDIPYREPTVYESLVRAIVYQQLSGKAAATIYHRFLDLFQDHTPHPDLVLAYEVEELRGVGLSRQKATYIQNVARHFFEKQYAENYWETQSDEAIVRELTEIKGVGEWTVQMLLMFTLQRPDVLPLRDLAIRNRAIQLFELEADSKREMDQKIIAATQPWRPHRTLACRYLWAWQD